MMPRIARVDQPESVFAEFFAAARAAGERVGWLDLDGSSEIPPAIGLAAKAGAFRAVMVTERDVLSCKHLAGPPVLRDLLREHFTGCRLVLVRGAVEAPEIAAAEGGWRVAPAGEPGRVVSTDELVALLRKPDFP